MAINGFKNITEIRKCWLHVAQLQTWNSLEMLFAVPFIVLKRVPVRRIWMKPLR